MSMYFLMVADRRHRRGGLSREPFRVCQERGGEYGQVLQGHGQKRPERPLRPQYELRQVRRAGLRRRGTGREHRKRLGEGQLQR